MKLKAFLIVTSLLSLSIHAMDLIKAGENSITSVLFNKLDPATVLKNNKTFAQEREEQLIALRKMVNPRVLTFVETQPEDKTAQGINRALNLVASKMAYFIGQDAPVLNQDPLSQNPKGNPIAALFNQSARVSRDTMVLLLPMEYFLNRETFLTNTLGEKADLAHKAFLRSIEQIGTDHDEMMYIEQGRTLTAQEAEELKRGADILCTYSSKAEFFTSFKKSIKKAKATDLVDEMVDFKTAKILATPEALQKLRTESADQNFGTSQDTALAILTSEQNGCSFNTSGSFSFDCNNELQTMVFAIADHKNNILAKIQELVTNMHTQANSFQIDADLKKHFLEEAQETKELVERAQERTKKLEFALAEDAKIIGPRTYALCNLYGTLSNLAKNSQDSIAQRLVNESMGMYSFVQMQG